MPKEYQGFAISNFRTGFDESVEPWLLPRDAYQSMINAHLYRGVLEKIEGYTLYARMSYRHELKLTPDPDGVTKTFTGTLTSAPTTSNFFGYGTISVGTTAETFTYLSDASATLINLVGSAGGTGTVNLSTLAVSLTFNTAPPSSAYSTVFFQWDGPSAGNLAIMGIKPYYSNNGSQFIMIFDQRRVGIVVNITGIIASNAGTDYGISEIPHDYYQSAVFTGDGTTTTFSGTLDAKLISPGTVRFIQYTSAGVFVSTIMDNGAGGLIGDDVTSGSINYSTGAYTITFTTAPATGNVFDSTAGVYGDLFTGSISNFFSLYNYQYNAFFTNDVDPVFYYDGTTIHYLNTSLTVRLTTSTAGVPTNYDITTCLHVFVNRERLLLIAPIVRGVGEVLSGVYWSTAGAPLNFTNAEFLIASTSESIRAFGFINSDLVMRFANSERIFRYTGDAFAPFRFDSTNNVWACDASYSAINYDKWFSSVGRPAIVGSDGVNVNRADEIIPDFTDPTRLAQQTPVPFMSQTSIQQCYGERFDDLKEGWLCYNSEPPSENQDGVNASNNVLAFNYLDKTYAVYAFPFSCLGLGRVINVPTWATTYTEWEVTDDTWDSYQIQNNALLDLGGDQFDTVYELNSGSTLGLNATGTITGVSSATSAQITSVAHGLRTGAQIVIQNVLGPFQINNLVFVVTVTGANTFTVPFDTTLLAAYISGGVWFGAPVMLSVVTKNFDPFLDDGQLARLGYVDLFVSADSQSTLRVQFYVNDQLYIDPYGNPAGYYQETILKFNTTDAMSPSTNQTKVWKRIYVGSVGKEHTIRFYQNPADFTYETLSQPIDIHGMVVYMKPAGRIFQ